MRKLTFWSGVAIFMMCPCVQLPPAAFTRSPQRFVTHALSSKVSSRRHKGIRAAAVLPCVPTPGHFRFNMNESIALRAFNLLKTSARFAILSCQSAAQALLPRTAKGYRMKVTALSLDTMLPIVLDIFCAELCCESHDYLTVQQKQFKNRMRTTNKGS